MKTLLLILVAVGSVLGYHYYIAPRWANNSDASNVESAAFKDAVKRSQQTAVKLYPALGKMDSQFNLRFRSGLAEWRRVNDPRLEHANWPEKLAAEIASQPAAISLTTPNGKTLYFNTMEQKHAYEKALDRTRSAAKVTPAPPRPVDFSDSPLNSGTLRSGAGTPSR